MVYGRLLMTLYIVIGAAFALILVAIGLAIKLKKTFKPIQIISILISVISLGMMIGSAIYIMNVTSIHMTAVKHGMTDDNITLQQMKDSIALSPEESKLPDDLTGAIVIYYRFQCPDCEAIYKQLREMTVNNDKVYWVSTRSKQGEALLDKYSVDEVPSGIYVRVDNYGNSIPYAKYVLYTSDNDDNVGLNNFSINRLLELQETQQ